jgi:hypothetical protein
VVEGCACLCVQEIDQEGEDGRHGAVLLHF